MKTTYTLILLSFISFSAFCQSIDKNGRTAQQRVTSVAPTHEISLIEDISAKTKTSFTLKYTLPAEKTTGEIILFHPRIDQVLKKVNVNKQQGSIEIPTKDLPVNIIAALYADNVPIKSTTIKLAE